MAAIEKADGTQTPSEAGPADSQARITDDYRRSLIDNIWLGAVILTLLSVAAIGVAFWIAVPGNPADSPSRSAELWSAVLVEIGGGLFIAGLGAAIVQLLVISRRERWDRFFKDQAAELHTNELVRMQRSVAALVEGIPRLEQQVAELEAHNSSQVELERAGVVGLFANAGEAYPAMTQAVKQSQTAEIRVMGIDLRMFIRSGNDDGPWYQIVKEIENRATAGSPWWCGSSFWIPTVTALSWSTWMVGQEGRCAKRSC
ncbi:hypothetical protein GCM10029992_32540 [Glycomyces albus]